MPKLLDQVRDRIRARHYSPRTEETRLRWVRDFYPLPPQASPQGGGGLRGQALPDTLGRLAGRRRRHPEPSTLGPPSSFMVKSLRSSWIRSTESSAPENQRACPSLSPRTRRAPYSSGSTGRGRELRHHVTETGLQRAVRQGGQGGRDHEAGEFAAPSATASPRTCWKTVTTSGRCRSY